MRFRPPGSLRLLLIVTVVSPTAAPLCVAESKDTGPEKHLVQIERRAGQGYTRDQIELAAAYVTGKGVPQDLQEAARWYSKAAKAGDPGAQNQIGYFYRAGIGVRADQERAVHWFQLASASGLPMAKVNLGVSYFTGRGLPQDASMARELFEEAEQQGLGLGAAYRGIMEYLGIGGAVDKAAAERWFEEGTKLHDPVSAFNLAYLYWGDEGHPHDLRKAVDLLRKSSDQGYVRAMHSLAFLLVKHPEFAASEQEAPELLEAASAAGDWRSSALLGMLSRKGQQVAKDPSRALYCFHLAVLQGGSEAQRILAEDIQRLANSLAAEEHTRVMAEADAWFAKHRYALMYVAKEGDAGSDFPPVAIADPAQYSLNAQ